MTRITHALFCEPAHTLVQGLSMKDRGEVNVVLAKKQHGELRCQHALWLGHTLLIMSASEQFPDSVFPEDQGIILQKGNKHLLVIARLAHKSRQGEEKILNQYLIPRYFSDRFCVKAPGFLEGGDVLVTDDHLYIGISKRTNEVGADQLARIAKNLFGYETTFISVPQEWLHLKSGVSYHHGWKGQRPVIIVAEQIVQYFTVLNYHLVVIPAEEHYRCYGPNCVSEERRILIHKGATTTKRLLERLDFYPREIDLSEFWKIDGAMTCLSKLFESEIAPA